MAVMRAPDAKARRNARSRFGTRTTAPTALPATRAIDAIELKTRACSIDRKHPTDGSLGRAGQGDQQGDWIITCSLDSAAGRSRPFTTSFGLRTCGYAS